MAFTNIYRGALHQVNLMDGFNLHLAYRYTYLWLYLLEVSHKDRSFSTVTTKGHLVIPSFLDYE